MPYSIKSPNDSQFHTIDLSPLQKIKGVLVLTLFALWAPFCIILAIIASVISRRYNYIVFRMFHRGVCKILGLKVKVVGEISRTRPIMYLFNHVSYLDIMAIGSHVDGYFVAKSEVGGWPILGELAKIQRTIFIERNPRRAKQQVEHLGGVMNKGQNLMIFPEGTSTDGTVIQRVKSSLLAAAYEADNGTIQPACVVYNDRKGGYLDEVKRDCYTWYGEMPFFDHLLTVAGLPGVEVSLVFGPEIKVSSDDDRKEVAEQVQKFMEQALQDHTTPKS